MKPLAVVTGASSGIGEALALRLAKAGYELLLVARRESLLQDLAKKTGGKVLAIDLTAEDAALKVFEAAPDAQLLVNNAGFGKVGEALSIDNAEYGRMLTLNVKTLTDLTLLYARQMVKRGGGTILNVASTSSFQPIPYQAVYAASKAYVRSFSEALSYELRGKGVNILCLHPGPTLTEFGAVAGSLEHQKKHAKLFMSADAVADLAMDQIKHGKESVIAGALNVVGSTLAQVGPRRVVRRVAAALFKPH